MMIMVQTGHKSLSQMRDKLRRMKEYMEELEECIAASEAREDTSRDRMRDYDMTIGIIEAVVMIMMIESLEE